MHSAIRNSLVTAFMIGAALLTQRLFHISDIWMAVSAVAVLGIVALMIVEGRLEELEQRVTHKNYTGRLKQLNGERRSPKHVQPQSLAGGGVHPSSIQPEHQVLFEDFRWFGALINKHIPKPWAIEELPTTVARGYDSPDIGRNYKVWYNACEVGSFQITVGSAALFNRSIPGEERSAVLDLSLNYLRFIPYQNAHGLLYGLSLLIGDFRKERADTCRALARAQAADALGGYLWEAIRAPDIDPTFTFRAEGSYDLVRDRTNEWLQSGYDPLASDKEEEGPA